MGACLCGKDPSVERHYNQFLIQKKSSLVSPLVSVQNGEHSLKNMIVSQVHACIETSPGDTLLPHILAFLKKQNFAVYG